MFASLLLLPSAHSEAFHALPLPCSPLWHFSFSFLPNSLPMLRSIFFFLHLETWVNMVTNLFRQPDPWTGEGLPPSSRHSFLSPITFCYRSLTLCLHLSIHDWSSSTGQPIFLVLRSLFLSFSFFIFSWKCHLVSDFYSIFISFSASIHWYQSVVISAATAFTIFFKPGWYTRLLFSHKSVTCVMLGVKAKIIFTALCLSIWVVLVAVGDIIFEMTFTFGCSKNKYILKTPTCQMLKS